jgi:uncharacterized membrane protein YeiH
MIMLLSIGVVFYSASAVLQPGYFCPIATMTALTYFNTLVIRKIVADWFCGNDSLGYVSLAFIGEVFFFSAVTKFFGMMVRDIFYIEREIALYFTIIIILQVLGSVVAEAYYRKKKEVTL